MTDVEVNVEVRDDMGSLDFAYRFTSRGGGEVGIEVGDRFEPSPAFGTDVSANMAQIGLDLVRKGLQLMGHDDESAKMICLLALGAQE